MIFRLSQNGGNEKRVNCEAADAATFVSGLMLNWSRVAHPEPASLGNLSLVRLLEEASFFFMALLRQRLVLPQARFVQNLFIALVERRKSRVGKKKDERLTTRGRGEDERHGDGAEDQGDGCGMSRMPRQAG